MPDWLKDLSADAGLEPSSADSDISAWPGAEADSASDTPSAGALPSWLGQMSEEQSLAQDPDRQMPSADSSLPDWLGDAAGESPAEIPEVFDPSSSTQAQEQLPDWMSGAAAESPDQTPASAEQLPSWLSGLVADEPAASIFEQPPPDTSAVDVGGVDESLPDWLQSQSGAEPAAPGVGDANAALWANAGPPPSAPGELAKPAPGTGEVDDSGVPGWLRDISDEEIRKVMEGDEESDEGISVEPFSFGEPSGSGAPSAASSADVPAWLPGASEDISSEPSWLGSLTDESGQSVAGGERDTGPSWLGSLTDEPAKTDAASQPDVPLWLQDLDASPAGEAPPVSPEQPLVEEQAATPPQDAAENIPAWLSETEQAPASADAVPAWLQEETTGAAPAEQLPAW
ncbi:MAG TPA: hypothetical protein VFO07_02200, partial [Roseiflexaceae bacterium]|nr:hypothetical protein [Roseiflexaceae bacterium]